MVMVRHNTQTGKQDLNGGAVVVLVALWYTTPTLARL